jgi:acyl carrier protein
VDSPADVAVRVQRLVEAQVQVEIPSQSTDLFETGTLDSLSLVELLVRLEEEFGTRIRLDELELSDLRSIASIARLLSRSNGHGS